MQSQKRPAAAPAGAREARTLAGSLGRDAQTTRRRRRLKQEDVALRIGISRPRYAEIERGLGENAPLATWVKIGIALGRPLAAGFSRDIRAEASPTDAGHLAAQELVLRLARAHGRRASVELATRPANPAAWADVVLRDDRLRILILVEIVNRSGNLGADVRTTDRKLAELESLAVLAGGDGAPYAVRGGWLLVHTAANRAIVGSFSELLRTRFPGSSSRWAQALATGTRPPDEPALAWIDARNGRIYGLRRRA